MQQPTSPDSKGKPNFHCSHFETQTGFFSLWRKFQPFVNWETRKRVSLLSANNKTCFLVDRTIRLDSKTMTKLSARYFEDNPVIEQGYEVLSGSDAKQSQVRNKRFRWNCVTLETPCRRPDLRALQRPHPRRVHHVRLEPVVARKVPEMRGLRGPAHRHVLRQERQHLLQRRLLQVGRES